MLPAVAVSPAVYADHLKTEKVIQSAKSSGDVRRIRVKSSFIEKKLSDETTCNPNAIIENKVDSDIDIEVGGCVLF